MNTNTDGVSAMSTELGATRWEYYYRVTECKAKQATDSDCICWHQECEGPFDNARHDEPEPFLEWRETPNAEAKGPRSGPA
jgi:hypothetical protein